MRFHLVHVFKTNVTIPFINDLILMCSVSLQPGAPRYPPKPYIVDLIHHPGRLMNADSPDAINYQKL